MTRSDRTTAWAAMAVCFLRGSAAAAQAHPHAGPPAQRPDAEAGLERFYGTRLPVGAMAFVRVRPAMMAME